MAVCVAALTMPLSACLPRPEGNTDLLKQPKGYDPKGLDGLTLNEAKLKEFVMMDAADRDAWVEKMKAEPGSFKGQAVFKSGAALGAAMEDAKYGEWELSATTEIIIFDVSLDFSIFCTKEQGKPLPPQRAIEFKGTILELDYDADAKPRYVKIKLKADEVATIKD